MRKFGKKTAWAIHKLTLGLCTATNSVSYNVKSFMKRSRATWKAEVNLQADTTSSRYTKRKQTLRVLVACEYSGRVREAFRKLGHDAWSCDLLPADDNSPYHIQDDVLKHLNEGWDMMIAHPPCTHLAVSGARWFKDKQTEQAEAL